MTTGAAKPAQTPYERALREAEEWRKTAPQYSLLRELIKRAEKIGGHSHDDGPWQHGLGLMPCDRS